MTNANNPTNRDVYSLINSVRLELKGDISAANTSLAANQGKLEKKFDDLEAGRLTRLEQHVAALQVAQAVSGTKLALIVAGITVVIGFVTSVLTKVLLK